ncbi:MAG: hypothetical protein ACN6P8_17000, partial [Achromobacter piechaudii]
MGSRFKSLVPYFPRLAPVVLNTLFPDSERGPTGFSEGNNMAFDFDLFVIGAGSGGVRAARFAAG